MVWWIYQALIEVLERGLEVLERGLAFISTHLFLFFRGSRVYAMETVHVAWGARRGIRLDTHRAPQVLPGQHDWQEVEETCYLAGHSTGLGLRWFQPGIKTRGWEQVWYRKDAYWWSQCHLPLQWPRALEEKDILFTLHRFMKNFSRSWNVLRTFKTTSKCFSAQCPKIDVIP